METVTATPYGPAADIYDLLYAAAGKDYAAEATVLVDTVRARCPSASSLLDVACGTGAHLEHLRPRFDEVVGVDLEPAMLAVARRRLSGVRLEVGDMRAFDLGAAFDAVTCLFSAIGAMRDVGELQAAVATMRRHLRPGGVLVVDGWILPEHWQDPGVVQALARDDPDGGRAVARVARSERRDRRTRLELHHLVGTPDGVEHLVEVHELTLFTGEEYVDALRAAGLGAEVVASPHPGRDRYIGTAP